MGKAVEHKLNWVLMLPAVHASHLSEPLRPAAEPL